MGIFAEKPIYKYRILERYKKDLNGCQLVGETEQYKLYSYKLNSNSYLLRQEKANSKKVVFLGQVYKHACIYQGMLYTIDRINLNSRTEHPLYCISLISGERNKLSVLSDKGCYIAMHWHCQDCVEALTVADDVLVMDITRYKENSSYEKECAYSIHLRYENGEYLIASNAPKKDILSYSEKARALGGVHEIIDILWGEEGVKTVVASSKETIDFAIREGDVRRKTELLDLGLDMCAELLEKAKKNPQTNLGANVITAFIWYRLFFECVLALDTDIVEVSEHYTLFQISKQLPSGMHPYVQTMIKIYDLLDRGIVYHYENRDTVMEDYFTPVVKRIRALLDAYTDDSTGWNKIVQSEL